MTKANDLASLLDANGDVVSSALDNVPAAPTPSLTSLGIPNHDEITVDGSGNVGIGTTTHYDSSTKLTVAGRINTSNGTAIGSMNYGGGTVINVGSISNHPLQFMTNNTTRATIDSSGNLLVGKSTSNYTTDGLEFRSDGQIFSSVGSDYTAYLNRKSTDGDILIFAKDAATVGSIGVGNTNRPYIGSGDTGIMFDATNNAIYPWDTSTNNVPASDQVDLGYNATGVRFKDLHLSGGVYLGGTSSANYLDDYEEGTWTPSIAFGGGSTGMTFVQRSGSYTKIGRLVYINGIIVFSNKGTSTGNVTFSNLPFTVADILPSTGNGGALNIHYFSDSTASHLYSFFAEGQNYGTGLYPQVDHGNELNQTDFNNNTSLRLNGVYQTT